MSLAVERYEKYKEDDFDAIMLRIKSGAIKSGRYAHLVKIDKNKKMKGKVFFDDDRHPKESKS